MDREGLTIFMALLWPVAALGLVLTMAGLWTGRHSLYLVAFGEEVVGTVHAVVPEVGGASGTAFRPHYTFRAADGREYRRSASVAADPSPWQEGDRVGVLYDPDDLSRVRIRSFATLWLTAVLTGGVGFVLLLASGGGLVVLRRRYRRLEAVEQEGGPGRGGRATRP